MFNLSIFRQSPVINKKFGCVRSFEHVKMNTAKYIR
jgi:hypothetical protein